MMKKNKYEPEDIENLLRNKTFENLLDEEREFILNHMDSEHEYQNMRSILLNLEENNWDDIPEMDQSIRMGLVKKHKDHHRRRMRVWLNTFFGIGTDKFKWHEAPGLQLAFASVLLFGIIFTFQNINDSKDTLADATIEKVDNLPPKIVEERTINTNSSGSNKQNILELSNSNIEITENNGSSNSNEKIMDESTFSNLDLDDNSSEEIDSEPVLDIDLVAKDQKKAKQSGDSELTNHPVELVHKGNSNEEDDIADTDKVEVQNFISPTLVEERNDLENIDAGDIAVIEENSHAKYGEFEQARESMTVLEITEDEVSEPSIASVARRNEVLMKKEEVNKTSLRHGIPLNKNPEIINQLFTSY